MLGHMAWKKWVAINPRVDSICLNCIAINLWVDSIWLDIWLGDIAIDLRVDSICLYI